MKYLVSILFVLASMNVFAQNWAPFPLSETSEWRIHARFPVTLNHGHDYCTGIWEYSLKITDTVPVDGHDYFYFSGSGTTNTPPGSDGCLQTMEPDSFYGPRLVRAENGIYYRRTMSGPEEVFANFNQSVGDTVPGLYYRIDSVDQVLINGISCRRQWISGLQGNIPDVWLIEGIGTNHGSFMNWYVLSHTALNQSLCYLENQVPLASGGFFNACTATGVNSPEAPLIKISPNPSTGIFNLDFQEQFNFQVYDLFGKLVLEGNGSGQTSIDLTDQPSGIYLLKVDSENGTSSIRLAKQ